MTTEQISAAAKFQAIAEEYFKADHDFEDTEREGLELERKLSSQRERLKRIRDRFASAVGTRHPEKIYKVGPNELVIVRLVYKNKGPDGYNVEVQSIEPKE